MASRFNPCASILFPKFNIKLNKHITLGHKLYLIIIDFAFKVAEVSFLTTRILRAILNVFYMRDCMQECKMLWTQDRISSALAGVTAGSCYARFIPNTIRDPLIVLAVAAAIFLGGRNEF